MVESSHIEWENKYNRSSFQIYLDILKTCQIEEKPTRIMYATNLSWKRFTAYLEKLLSTGYLEKLGQLDKRTKVRYKTTDKANRLLHSMESSRAFELFQQDKVI